MFFLSMFRDKTTLVYVLMLLFLLMSCVKYNMFSYLFLCSFSVRLHFGVTFIRKRVGSNI
ncbi:hypothetical protein Hanom_Chr01g00044961 [Helianthus anomalus]